MAGGGRRLSVAIASFNGAAYIVDQLESIAAQSLLPDEVIISDDGSTDQTVALAEEFGRDAPFEVRVVSQPERLGILNNFYAAFAACTGDVIAYCDQDDVWLPTKLERQVTALNAGAVLVAHPSCVVDGMLRPLGRQEPVNYKSGALAAPVDPNGVRAFGHQMLFRRAVLNVMLAIRPIAQELNSDGVVVSFDRYIPLCASLLGGITVLPEPLILFRRHASATSEAGGGAQIRTRRERAAIAIARDLADTRETRAIVEAALAQGLVPAEPAGRLATALRSRNAALIKLARLEAEPSRFGRLRRLPSVLTALLRATSFSNHRPLHEAGVALVTAIR